MKIPPDYKITRIPTNYNFENDLIKITYKSNESEDTIAIEGLVNFKKAVYAPQDYEKLKIYFNRIINKFNDKIILQKKSVEPDVGNVH